MCDLIVLDGRRRGKIELIGGLYTCCFFEQGHQPGEIKELGKARPSTVAGSLRRELEAVCVSPKLEAQQSKCVSPLLRIASC